MSQVTLDEVAQRPAGSGRAWTAWATVFLVAVVVALFARTIGFGFYLDDYILARPWSARELGEAFTGQFDVIGSNDPYFRPLSSVSFALEWHLWGTDIWGYHVTNIVLHAAATIGVFALLRRVRVAWWAALVGAVVFAAIPSNVATVVYIAERTDAMVAIFLLCSLLCVHRYHRSGRLAPLIALNAFFVLALLAKEVAVAGVPMVALYWWYLRTEQLDPAPDAVSGQVRPSVPQHWAAELRLYGAALIRRDGRRDWVRLLGPMLAILACYLVYRQAALPPGSLSGRFAETQNPVSAVLGGIRSTVKGGPWEVRSWAVFPLLVGLVLAFVLAPRARAWRVVLLGFGFIVAGVLPLAFSGGVEPRLLYVAEIGVAIGVAGVAHIFGHALTRSRETSGRGLAWVAVAVVAVAFSVATIVTMVRAQDVFSDGSEKMLEGDQRAWESATMRPKIVPSHLEAIEQRLIESGVIDPP